ncbi:MAG: hypothetical protein QM813_12540 [Verrucomicrobiota bacterium]
MNASLPNSAKTVNSPRSVSETIALLDRLRRTVRDSVKRRDELERETALRTNRLRAQHTQAITAERARSTAESTTGNESAAKQQATAEARGASRRQRIAKALANARRQRGQEIDNEESKHTLTNQDGLLEAERGPRHRAAAKQSAARKLRG